MSRDAEINKKRLYCDEVSAKVLSNKINASGL
jgi:hypothetical protein